MTEFINICPSSTSPPAINKELSPSGMVKKARILLFADSFADFGNHRVRGASLRGNSRKKRGRAVYSFRFSILQQTPLTAASALSPYSGIQALKCLFSAVNAQ